MVSINKVPDSGRSRKAIQEDLNQGLLLDDFNRLDQEIFRAALLFLKVTHFIPEFKRIIVSPNGSLSSGINDSV